MELRFAALHRDRTALTGKNAAAGPQLGLHGRDAVALFDAEPLGVPDHGRPLTQQAQNHQHRAQVGAVGQVDVHAVERGLLEHKPCLGPRELCPAAAQDVQNGRVALQGLGGQPGKGDAALDGPQHGEERCLAVIALHDVITGVVLLPARDAEGGVVQPMAGDAECRLRGPGHLNVAAALHRRDEVQGAVPGQQGQGEQQPADELAGHIARQRVLPAAQASGHGQLPVCLLEMEILLSI